MNETERDEQRNTHKNKMTESSVTLRYIAKKACRLAMQPMISAADYDDVSELVWSTSHWYLQYLMPLNNSSHNSKKKNRAVVCVCWYEKLCSDMFLGA